MSKGFGQDQTLYTVTITWKNGFTHSYEQLLNDKQLTSEQDRFETYRWIDKISFNTARKNTNKK